MVTSFIGHSLGEALWETTGGTTLTQEAVLKVNSCLSNQIIGRDTIPVHDGDSEGVVKGEDSREFKHLAKDGVELTWDVVVLVVDLLLSNLHLQEWVRLYEKE